VQNGDRIKLSVKARSIALLVDDAELKRRAAKLAKTAAPATRGYAQLYAREILGADQGCDFAFLKAR
jgi:dihydroxy-acid dehydratase